MPHLTVEKWGGARFNLGRLKGDSSPPYSRLSGALLKQVTVTALILILLPAVGYPRGYEAKKKVGDYEIEIRIDKNPVVLGNNHIEIEVKSGGKIVKDAEVLVNYYMPPMPGMPPMNYKSYAKLKGEKYRATMNIIMKGPWIVAIKIYQGEKKVTTKINVDAQ